MPAISAFPNCCGACVITGVGSDPSGIMGFKLTPDGMGYAKDADGKNIPETFAERFKRDVEGYKKSASGGFLYTIIATTTQLEGYKGAWKALLKDAGFEPVRRWTNKVHSDREFLYLFTLCVDPRGRCKGDHTSSPPGWDALPTQEEQETSSLFQKVKTAMAA